jgi:hypothetical protein
MNTPTVDTLAPFSERQTATTQPRLARLLSVIVALLAFVASAGGLFWEGLYRDNTLVTAAFRGNDLITLVVAVPGLLLADRDGPDGVHALQLRVLPLRRGVQPHLPGICRSGRPVDRGAHYQPIQPECAGDQPGISPQDTGQVDRRLHAGVCVAAGWNVDRHVPQLRCDRKSASADYADGPPDQRGLCYRSLAADAESAGGWALALAAATMGICAERDHADQGLYVWASITGHVGFFSSCRECQRSLLPAVDCAYRRLFDRFMAAAGEYAIEDEVDSWWLNMHRR